MCACACVRACACAGTGSETRGRVVATTSARCCTLLVSPGSICTPPSIPRSCTHTCSWHLSTGFWGSVRWPVGKRQNGGAGEDDHAEWLRIRGLPPRWRFLTLPAPLAPPTTPYVARPRLCMARWNYTQCKDRSAPRARALATDSSAVCRVCCQCAKGAFANNAYNGKGKYTWSNGTVFQSNWVSAWCRLPQLSPARVRHVSQASSRPTCTAPAC